MQTLFVVSLIGLPLALLYAWGFRVLPRERWQILAAIPVARESDGTWRGVNLTWYGFFCALGAAVAVAVTLFLAASAGLGLPLLAISAALVAPLVLVAARLMNRWVEGHGHGFTVGGGSFIGILLTPWIIGGLSRTSLGSEGADLILMSALAPAYVLGEGVGRLACLSFGCCYGRPIRSFPAPIQRWWQPLAVRFCGPLKKAVYAEGYANEPLVPVQAMTSVVLSVAGLAGIAAFLGGAYRLAMILPVLASQGWRFLSEFWRSDDRGGGRLSAYQIMALMAAFYWTVVGVVWKGGALAIRPSPLTGAALLTSRSGLALVGAVAMAVFIRMGISTVTTARLSFGIEPSAVPPFRIAGGSKGGKPVQGRNGD